MKKTLFSILFILSIAGLYAQTCNSYFTYEIDSLNNVTFSDSSTTTGSIINWYWNFGDGTTSSDTNPTHNFSPGSHAVCLTISTNDSCTSWFCDTLLINQVNPCSGFSVNLNVTNTSGPNATNGSITTTISGGNPPFLYFWDTGETTSGIFNHATGSYCLTVIDSDSCTYTGCADIIVDTLIYCSADFNIQSGYCLNCFQYTDTSSSSSAITNWFWDFGDGNSSTIQSPNHVYLDSGYYNICLTIITVDSCASTFCDSILAPYNVISYSVSGQIFYDINLLGSGTVELYETNLESHHPPLYSETVINGNYNFPNVASGTYKLLAIPDSPISTSYAPTYFGDKTNWSDAYTLSIFSNLISVDVHLQTNTNGVTDNEGINNILVSPNPFSDILSIHSDELINSINILTISGEVLSIKKPNNKNAIINTALIPSGIYIISILTQGNIYSKKLIKL